MTRRFIPHPWRFLISLTTLAQLITITESPVETGTAAQWQAVEAALHLVLPQDYKTFVNTYGTCIIGNFIFPLNPFAASEHSHLIEYNNWWLNELRQFVQEDGIEQCPYPIYPEPSGVFCWGKTENGDVLFWRTEGDPDKWTTLINAVRSDVYEEYPYSMTEFLVRALNHEIAGYTELDEHVDPTLPFQVLHP